MHLSSSHFALSALSLLFTAIMGAQSLAMPGAGSIFPNTGSLKHPHMLQARSALDLADFQETTMEKAIGDMRARYGRDIIFIFWGEDSILPASPPLTGNMPNKMANQRVVRVTCYRANGSKVLPWPKRAGEKDTHLVIAAGLYREAGGWKRFTGYVSRDAIVYTIQTGFPGERALGIIDNPVEVGQAIHDTPVEAREGENSLQTTRRWFDAARTRLKEQKLWVNPFAEG
ncbi:MAG: hypothetical protein M1829_000338 [Trizodia sp. TS-e1964]|nr:MAG: hypothetical protein M1829_000338 [Trizodia sp. TS-e1964]